MSITMNTRIKSLLADRRKLIEALRELHGIDERKLKASERKFGHSVIQERVERNRALLRELGEE